MKQFKVNPSPSYGGTRPNRQPKAAAVVKCDKCHRQHEQGQPCGYCRRLREQAVRRIKNGKTVT